MSQPQNALSPEASSKNTALIGGVVVVVIAIIAGFAYGQKKPNEAPVAPTQDTVDMVPLTPPNGATNTGSMMPPVAMERSSSTDGSMVAPPPKPAPNKVITAPKPTGSTGSATKTAFKDGTYTANGIYRIHAGEEEIRVTITLKNDVITATSFEITPKFPMSKRFIDMFSENYKPLVIGKKISELNLGRVSGSSLTPVGFNNALEKIKTQAGV